MKDSPAAQPSARSLARGKPPLKGSDLKAVAVVQRLRYWREKGGSLGSPSRGD